MDSDLSLLEIAGEDDSLLQIPRDDSGVGNSSSIFSCSPLHCVRSLPPRTPQTGGTAGAVSIKKLSFSSKDGINKENINGNKFEAPKLNLEPQKMKRKKKGGGYNLRKSLAWDRAFFTEEGVLNSLELSMISGNQSSSNNELTIIHEEEENTLVGEADIVGASSELQKIEENLFKQLSEDRKIGACLQPNSDALTKDTLASASLATRKVIAVNDSDRSRSKRNACPRPIAASSLKRPNMAKAQSKESKVSKIPISKTHAPMITMTARSGASSTGYSKRNQNSHSVANVQKNTGVKGLPKNPSVPINAKFDVAAKCSITSALTQQARKDIDNLIADTHRPPRLQHQLLTEGNKGLKLQPPLHVCSTGEKTQKEQFQTAKPSGLRMPSPSLGFFSQQKAVSSQGALHKSSRPCKPTESNPLKSKKVAANSFHEARLPHATLKRCENVNDAVKSCTPNLGLSDVKSEPSGQVQNNQMAKVEVQCYSLGSGEIAKQEKVDKTLEHKKGHPSVQDSHQVESGEGQIYAVLPLQEERLFSRFEPVTSRSHDKTLEHVNKKSLEEVEPFKIENVLKRDDIEFHINDNKLLLDSGMDEQLETKVDQNLFVFQEPESMHHSSMHRTLTEKDNLLNISQNDMKQEVDEQTKPVTCDAQISNGNLVLQANHDTSSKDSTHSREFKEYNYMKTVQVNSSQLDFNESGATGASLEGIPCQSTKEAKDGIGEHFTSQLCQREQVNCCSRGNDIPINKDCNMSEFQFRVDRSSKATSMHCDSSIAKHDDHRNSEPQTRLLTSSKMDYMVCGNESSVANHSHLLDESDSFEVSANSDSDTKDYTKDGAGSPSGLHEHKLLAQAIREPDYTERVIENLHVEDTEVLFSDEKLTKYRCNNNPSASIAKDQFLLVVDSLNKESPLLEIQRPSLVDDVDFQHVNLNSDLLPAKSACSEETRNEGALEQCNDYTSEYSTSNHHIRAIPEIKDGSLDEEEGAQCLQMDVSEKVSTKIVEVELNHKVNAANLVTSIQGNEDQITDSVDWNCNERCSLSESLKLEGTDNLTSHRRISQGSEPSSLKRKSLSEEAENSTSGEDEISSTNVQNQIAEGGSNIICHKKSAIKRKQDVAVVIPPPNAAPFSDEWLAAMEAAGEEILAMKGGAVQNSPPDKPQHEPGPWSPVRRKNQEIGPYDCTKYTNMNNPDSDS